MKLVCADNDEVGLKVAPRAGAWIETGDKVSVYGNEIVAPRAGAWIETSS